MTNEQLIQECYKACNLILNGHGTYDPQKNAANLYAFVIILHPLNKQLAATEQLQITNSIDYPVVARACKEAGKVFHQLTSPLMRRGGISITEPPVEK